MTTPQTSRKRKRVSKNKKKNWRKTDITDVEEYLDDVRIQERTGGLAEEKTDAQLFFVDTVKKDVAAEEPVPVKRLRRQAKPLKCHAELLNPYPVIKPFRVTTNTRKESAKKLCAAKRNKTELTKLEKTSLAQRKEAKMELRERRKDNRKFAQAEFDLWGEKDINRKPEELEDYFAVKTRKIRTAVPITAQKKPSGLKAIETPHPGQSYNPTFEDHQELLRSALTVEVFKTKEEAKINRALDEKFPERGRAPTEQSYLQEMSAGLFDEGEADVEVTAQDMAAISVNPPIRRENKKTEKQRKKQEAVKQRAKARLQLKEDKIRDKEMSRLKSLQTEVKKRETRLAEKEAKKAQMREDTKDRTRKLGKLKYEDPNIPIKLSDELKGSLRELKPEGSLLEDRYKSLQKRNIVEPRQWQKKVRKYKPKNFVKKSHKEVTI